MRRERILDYLRAALTALSRDGIAAETIVGPNELADTADAPLFFQVYATEGERRRETERADVVRVTGVVVVNGRLGEGAARLDAVADRVERFFAPTAPGARGLVITPRPGTPRTLVYTIGARRGAPEVVDGRYKTTVNVEFEIYEEE